MSFLKNVASSFVGSTLAFLIAGTILIFVFIGALVGGLVSAAAGGDASEQEAVSKAKTVLTIDFSQPISERSTNDANFDLTGFQSNSTMGLRDFTEVLQEAAFEGGRRPGSGACARPTCTSVSEVRRQHRIKYWTASLCMSTSS